MSEWQLIEIEPPNNCIIAVYGPGCSEHPSLWKRGNERWNPVNCLMVGITHWMPLPEPPTTPTPQVKQGEE